MTSDGRQGSPRDVGSGEGGTTSRMLMYGMLLGFAIVTLLAACSLGGDKQEKAYLHGSEHWEDTASHSVLPGFLKNETNLTKELYSEVHKHAHIISGINCYCGCMAGTELDEPHDSLLRCYWAEHPADDGSVTWTDHSTNCGICKKEMELVVALNKQGLTPEQIRDAVDDSYKPNK